eukprot:CAMPEP_0202955684 /NCGR_PEP_ID=MMETSP1396-20130829/223_1 /ASSEMBLY_ACC=CAM_ASM_000872 /TAXON_ID= /ORGANISM="Pseudokeronopsis sp., Strain Brazil" /LENGTH=99 /DNA_ID=CAMNT_0049672353 /DNA_START=83 /DNA_END=382 /DNA_ORIENTATION=+
MIKFLHTDGFWETYQETINNEAVPSYVEEFYQRQYPDGSYIVEKSFSSNGVSTYDLQQLQVPSAWWSYLSRYTNGNYLRETYQDSTGEYYTKTCLNGNC